MADDRQDRTLSALIAALVRAKTRGRDFYLTMIEAFAYLPDVADVWRSLMFEECMHLHRLREIESDLTSSAGSHPVEQANLDPAHAVASILSDDRIRRIRTLEDAVRLLTEYETSGLNAMVVQVTTALSKNAGVSRRKGFVIADAESRLASIQKRFGNPSRLSGIHAARGGALPSACGPRQCAV